MVQYLLIRKLSRFMERSENQLTEYKKAYWIIPESHQQAFNQMLDLLGIDIVVDEFPYPNLLDINISNADNKNVKQPDIEPDIEQKIAITIIHQDNLRYYKGQSPLLRHVAQNGTWPDGLREKLLEIPVEARRALNIKI